MQITPEVNIILYKHLDFWNNEGVYYEQPNVEYNDELIMVVNDTRETKTFSSILYLNQFFDPLLNIPMIKYEIFDDNHDGLNDTFKFKINFPVNNVKTITNIKLYLFFKYSLNTNIQGSIERTLCEVDINTPLGVSYVKINGDLVLKQKFPLSSSTFSVGNYKENILNVSETYADNTTTYLKNDVTDFNIESKKEYFYNRDVYTVFDYSKVVIPYKNRDVVQIELTVNIPSFQAIMWEIPIAAKIKFAWVQFMAIFIPVYVILRLIQFYIFKNRIFPSVPVSDLPKMRIR